MLSIGKGEERNNPGRGWWTKLFHHGADLKKPDKLQQFATLFREKGWQALAVHARGGEFQRQR